MSGGSGGGGSCRWRRASSTAERSRERRLPGEHLVQHDADRVHVRCGARGPAASLLGRHVPRGADDCRGAAVSAALGQPGHAEVGDLDPAVGRDQHVRRLDVAMNDALRVGRSQRTAELLRDPARRPGRNRPAAQTGREALPVHELGDVVETLVSVPDVEDLDDARIVDTGQQLRFALEAAHPDRILGPPWLDHLDRHGPGETTVDAAVDASERPLADHGEELIAPVQGTTGQIRCSWHKGDRWLDPEVDPTPHDREWPACPRLRRLDG